MGWSGGLIMPLLLSLAWAGTAHADIDTSEYELKSSIRSEKEREQFRAQLEKSRVEEVERERAQAEAEARRHAEEMERLAARPYPVRLLEARCTVCHAATNYENQNHTWLGWWLVVSRMEYFSKVALNSGERGVIVAHLTETRPGDTRIVLMEYGALAVSLLGAALLVWQGVRRIRQKRQRNSYAGDQGQ
ncbi:MAG: hypothetical protein A3F73_02985 [Gallionellales bacterium RIFCSPLOWO2_12_FULL_59_22]|nr:MAG: hypothetical protein A3H99_06690 [Gallionellales bacterium RIFCSPLOWO2_02_FULL_59_110]OGT02903.1 MAG: hypothetical protein A2Z65_03205 [Gallionellales bacterium RIFCSPLOWO2_02_58_13]OGT13096.1 MAG: hypothetical protein A3F73_02985 [Gallionellales bacterium RIFCSPLOWO2_12_FULL_59_22]